MKRDNIKRMIAFACAVSLVFGGNAGILTSAASKSVSLSKANVTLKVGKTHNLTVKKAKNVTIKSKTFTTSNKKIATVTKAGEITAKKAGKATITVKVKWAKKSSKKIKSSTLKCKVTVQKNTSISEPGESPTVSPSPAASEEPTMAPTIEPTAAPTVKPSEEPIKTPMEAVQEMTWGVNLAGNFMDNCGDAFGSGPYQKNTVGYCRFAPMGMGISFWNGDYEWLTVYGPNSEKFSVSAPIPDYKAGQSTDAWVGGLFSVGIQLRDSNQTAKIALSDSKIIKSDGTELKLEFMNQTYSLKPYIYPSDDGWYYGQLYFDKNQLPAASAELNGARFEATVEVKDISIPKGKTKADYFFHLNRTTMDPEKLTDLYLDEGANVVRLPVTWTSFTNNETFEIDEEWLELVKKEVDYIIGKGAYCILNTQNDYLQNSFVGDHWEIFWMNDEYKDYVDKRFVAIWTQIAEYFKDYSQKLIFEPFNEPTMAPNEGSVDWDNDWDKLNATQARRINEMNKLFVDTVRDTGGKNETRFLYLAVGNYCDAEWLEKLELPEDDDYLIAAVHSYGQMEIAWQEIDINFDYKSKTDRMFEVINKFTEKTGVPVIIGEAGVTHREAETVQAKKVAYFFKKGKTYGIPSLWWEGYFVSDYFYWQGITYWLYDKDKDEWGRREILDAIKNVFDSNSIE